MKPNDWVEIRIPIAKIPRHNDVRYIQFHISEANYKHGDKLDLYIDDLALLRYARPTILDFSAETGVAFTDAHSLAAQFHLSGVRPGETVPVVCELRRGNKVAARSNTLAARGPQRVAIHLAGLKLVAGTYELVVRAADSTEAKAVVRLVESPWR
ncbi:MAG: hypothetical protein N3B01_03145 [Verrucomicrobiae bacterium]|nr:hypothetical protein [Verrucomicrobiae bacterium]